MNFSSRFFRHISCDTGEYYLDYETAAKHETTPEELMASDTPPLVFEVVVIRVVK